MHWPREHSQQRQRLRPAGIGKECVMWSRPAPYLQPIWSGRAVRRRVICLGWCMRTRHDASWRPRTRHGMMAPLLAYGCHLECSTYLEKHL
eukprot:scaffold1414_cov384-Prasinococcus_capsulatus_cf.AAC.1